MKKVFLVLPLLLISLTAQAMDDNKSWKNFFRDMRIRVKTNATKARNFIYTSPALHGMITAGIATGAAHNYFDSYAQLVAEIKNLNPASSLKVFTFPHLTATQTTWVKAGIAGVLFGAYVWKNSKNILHLKSQLPGQENNTEEGPDKAVWDQYDDNEN